LGLDLLGVDLRGLDLWGRWDSAGAAPPRLGPP